METGQGIQARWVCSQTAVEFPNMASDTSQPAESGKIHKRVKLFFPSRQFQQRSGNRGNFGNKNGNFGNNRNGGNFGGNRNGMDKAQAFNQSWQQGVSISAMELV